MVSASGYIVLTCRFAQEPGGPWEAECLELGAATFADTMDQAQTELAELIELQLNTLEDMGAARAYFKKHNIVFHRTEPKPTAHDVKVRVGEFVTRVAEPILAVM